MPQKGFKHSIESRAKMRKSHLGVKLSPTHVKNAALARRGTKLTEEHKKKIREAQLGRHPGWKGDKVSYSGLHKRFVRWYGPASVHPCSVCGKKKPEVKRIEWSNLDGKYTFDRESWEPMCSRCHTLHHRILKLMNK